MTDQPITGWRTVATHGQPTGNDLPVLIRTAASGVHVRHSREAPLTQPDTHWIPIAELDALPAASPPPRTITIAITDDDARRVMENGWNENMLSGRILVAVKAALEADEAAP